MIILESRKTTDARWNTMNACPDLNTELKGASYESPERYARVRGALIEHLRVFRRRWQETYPSRAFRIVEVSGYGITEERREII